MQDDTAPDHDKHCAGPSAPAVPPAAGDVLNLIEDVEAQLARFRDAQARQTEAMAALEDRRKAIESSESAVAEARSLIESRVAELDERAATLELEKQAADDARLAMEVELNEARSRLREVEEDSSRSLEASAERLLQAEGRIGELEAERDAMRSQLNLAADRLRLFTTEVAEQSSPAPVAAPGAGDLEELEARCEKAELRADELEQALVLAQDRGQADAFAKQLRSKAERIQVVARHLALRRRRLQAIRSALQSRRSMVIEPATEMEIRSDEPGGDQPAVDHLPVDCSDGEAMIIRRSTRSPVLVGAAWCTILLLVVGVASWFTVERIMPMPGSARVDINAASATGETLRAGSLDAWHAWHTALPTDPDFAGVVGERLQMRGLAPGGGETAVAELLATRLDFDSDHPGHLRLVLSGPDRRLLPDMLDVVVTSMVSESARQAPRRPQSARAELTDERRSGAAAGYASLVPAKRDTAYLERFALVAGVGIAVGLGLVVLGHGLLRRSRRLLAESEPDLGGLRGG